MDAQPNRRDVGISLHNRHDAVSPAGSTGARPSPWAPFGHKAFAVIWTATVASNIGGWMYSAAAGWLMTGLDTDPLMVSLVQVAASLPMFLFVLPAGAITDIVDKRRFLIGAESFTTLLASGLAVLVWLGRITPLSLLWFVFVLGVASAMTAPPWQAVVPQLVPRNDLSPAVAMNSVGVNISRAVGPALGGLITAALGIAAPFGINAVSNLGSIGALVWWRPPSNRVSSLPAERFVSALRTGIRYARNSNPLRATLWRALPFFFFASCYWALLPLVARHQLAGGATLYGLLLGAIGASATLGAFALPRVQTTLGPNRTMVAASIGTALALALFGVARAPQAAVAASVIAGVCWIAAMSTLNVSAQFALPEWVRGRGLAVYVTALFGALTLGSAVWGQVARTGGLPMAHYIAAAGALLTVPATWRWKLQTGVGVDLSPSMHWPAPAVTQSVDGDLGPVLVTVEYRIKEEERGTFLAAVERLSHERRRDGAYSWGLYEDVGDQGRFVETFLIESWLEHLRQHERVTNADRILQEELSALVMQAPRTSHFVAARRRPRSRPSAGNDASTEVS